MRRACAGHAPGKHSPYDESLFGLRKITFSSGGWVKDPLFKTSGRQLFWDSSPPPQSP